MKKTSGIVLVFLLSLIYVSSGYAEGQNRDFESFTGRITRNKVRMRLEPNLDSQIVREMDRDAMLIVVGEDNDFYSILPTEGIHGYVYKPYVVDGVIDGDKVNVRLEPAIEAPVIAQLGKGDIVNGHPCPVNSKWIEIEPPVQTRFFICKDYIEKIGDPKLMANIEKRRKEVNELLDNAYKLSQNELKKPFELVNLSQSFDHFSRIIDEFHDFPDQVGRAKELLLLTQDAYLQKKIEHLEAKTYAASHSAHQPLDKIAEVKISPEKPQPQKKTSSTAFDWENHPKPLKGNMIPWVGVERKLFEEWAKESQGSLDDFYHVQLEQSESIRGIIQSYSRPIKNKPGDFVLLSQATRQPIAYLYSTRLNLKELEGTIATLKVAPRNNNKFAFPAYFVLEAR